MQYNIVYVMLYVLYKYILDILLSKGKPKASLSSLLNENVLSTIVPYNCATRYHFGLFLGLITNK